MDGWLVGGGHVLGNVLLDLRGWGVDRCLSFDRVL